MSFYRCTQCEYENTCPLRSIAPDLDGCSGHGKLHHRYSEEKERLMQDAKVLHERQSLRNENLLKTLTAGDKVRLTGSTISLGLRLPRYLDNGIFTVLGISRNGKVKCDWDGGKPFYIPPSCLEKIDH